MEHDVFLALHTYLEQIVYVYITSTKIIELILSCELVMWESSARNICIYLRQACFSELLIFLGNEWVPCKTSKLQRDKIVIAHMITAFMNNF